MGRLTRQDVIDVDASLAENGTQSSLCHITGVVWQGNLSPGDRMPPDFVATWSLSVERETQGA